MPTERDDDETEYGRWQTSTAKTLAEENNAPGLDEPSETWPDWREGVPAVFRRKVGNPPFYQNGLSRIFRLVGIEMERRLSALLFSKENALTAKHQRQRMERRLSHLFARDSH